MCECGGNVHEREIVNVKASGALDYDGEDNERNNLVGLKRESRYRAHTWICLDFMERSVRLTSFTLAGSRLTTFGSRFVEVSYDGTNNTWLKLDRFDVTQREGCD